MREEASCGIVVSHIANFYYVVVGGMTFSCVPRGRFKKQGVKIYVGDKVLMTITSAQEGVIEEVLPRTNLFLRPAVANTEQVAIVCSTKDPPPDLTLIDRISVHAGYLGLPTAVCMNKIDLPAESDLDLDEILRGYAAAGFETVKTSTVTSQGIDRLKEVMAGKISVLAGQSGVGKSSLLNALSPDIRLRVGQVSPKSGQGRHTTRHTQLVRVGESGLVADTPGFHEIDTMMIPKAELQNCFPEFKPFSINCRFAGCLHRAEPSCGVRDAVSEGLIAGWRYSNYLRFLEEIQEYEQRRYS